MKFPGGLLIAFLVAGSFGCAQTDPNSVCSHIARLQHGSAPNAADRIADYERLCRAPMTQAKLDRPIEYKCWSKCIVQSASWPETVGCDSCVGSATQFELFQASKTKKKQQQREKTVPPVEGGACSDDAACQ
jgi:hypothetical protein